MARTITTNKLSGTAILAVAGILAGAAAPAQAQNAAALSSPAVRSEFQAKAAGIAASKKQAALNIARLRGWKTESVKEGFELMEVSDNGMPVYYKTLDVNAAISDGSLEVQTSGIADGAGVKVGVWDQGMALASHQEFGGRVRMVDSSTAIGHSTAVAGVIAAAGVNPAVRGQASAALVDSYTWGSDVAELVGVAMAAPGEAGKIQISNHSYGSTHGWVWGSYSGNGTAAWHWFGAGYSPDGRGNLEDPNFGAYGSRAGVLDQIAVDAPYLLQVRAAGNNRNDSYGGARDGSGMFYYIDPASWIWMPTTWTASTAPADGNGDQGGFDTIIMDATAKNILTVGSTTDAVLGGVRTPSVATSSAFSAWGPADDGRIKPDVVANGDGMTMPTIGSTSAYGSSSGTSFSSPGAAGVAALLVQEAATLLPGTTLRASTLKGLLIHGATDIGNAGPDYKYGWGLVDAVASIEPLLHQAANPMAAAVTEATLNNTTAPSFSRTVSWDGASDLVATLCWTDPVGTSEASPSLDDRTPELVHDLDLRIVVGGVAQLPFKLDPTNPNQPATRADNTVDNVEQVRIAAGSLPAGNVQVVVSKKRSLSLGSQAFSLILSGQDAAAASLPVVQSPTPSAATSGDTLLVSVAANEIPAGTGLSIRREGRANVLPLATTVSGGTISGSFFLDRTEPGTWYVSFDLANGTSIKAGNFEVRAASLATLFSDDFNDSRASKAKWTLSGAAVAKVSGASVLKLTATNSAVAAFSTAGKGGLMLSCALASSSFENGDKFFAEISTDNGATWQVLQTVTANATTAAAIQLPASADNKSSVRIRFRGAMDSKDTVTVDNVLVTGANQFAW